MSADKEQQESPEDTGKLWIIVTIVFAILIGVWTWFIFTAVKNHPEVIPVEQVDE